MCVARDDPYMRMDKLLESDYLHMEKRKQSDDKMFYLEGCDNNSDNIYPSSITLDYVKKKPPKIKNNLFSLGRHKGELQMHESMGRHFKKGNKYKDDYVFFNLEKNQDYVDMGKARTNKWHFLDFRNRNK